MAKSSHIDEYLDSLIEQATAIRAVLEPLEEEILFYLKSCPSSDAPVKVPSETAVERRIVTTQSNKARMDSM